MEIIATVARFFSTLLLGGAAMVAMFWTIGFLAQRSVTFPIPRTPGPPRPDNAEQLWFSVPSGRVEAWLLRAGESDRAAPLVIFTHGNAELIDHRPVEFEDTRRAGVHVLLVEYPGYGRSQGRPSQKTITHVMLAAYDAVVRRPEVDRERIVAYGRSLGGGAAAVLATQRPVAALILESSFTSVAALARRFGLPRFLVRDPFDNVAAVSSFSGPVLLLHGTEDEVIPSSHSVALQEAAGSALLKLLPCGHNDCPNAWPEIKRFLAAHGLL
jgi:fermentation-respiration switch protein FrsA (DUF1100 family)